MKRIGALLLVTLFAASAAFATGIREQMQFNGSKRTVYFYVPKALPADHPAPLLLLLHGSGRNGEIMIDNWKSLADKEGIVLAAPDAVNPQAWNLSQDSPAFFQAVVEAAKAKAAIDERRLYLFGHSAGAETTLILALLESEYFAAAALHAGALRGNEQDQVIPLATRKIPFYITVGDRDQFFPLDIVRSTRDGLKKAGFAVTLDEIKGHDHNYYVVANDVNRKAWEFLKDKSLADKPKFTPYAMP